MTDIDDNRKDRDVRTFGVEEELLLVDSSTLEPLPAGEWAMGLLEDAPVSGHELTTELQQEQLEIISPPQTTLAGQLAAIRTGRALAEDAATRVGGRVVALPTAPGMVTPHLYPAPRCRRIEEQFGLTAAEQLTNGFHIHVGVDSPEEGVGVLDRIRTWLPVILALSANSPFWYGNDTGYASYRYQAWSRWPSAGPTDVFGSVAGYDRHRTVLLGIQVPLDAAMLHHDARLCEDHPTLEVRIADVCLHPEHTAVLAALARALVETAARQWRTEAPDVPASLLRTWSWQASRTGVEGRLIDPATGTPAPAGDVVARLLEVLCPVLAEYGEEQQVEDVVADILRHGSGAHLQRQAYADRHDLRDVVVTALEATHRAPLRRSASTGTAKSSVSTTRETGEGTPMDTSKAV